MRGADAAEIIVLRDRVRRAVTGPPVLQDSNQFARPRAGAAIRCHGAETTVAGRSELPRGARSARVSPRFSERAQAVPTLFQDRGPARARSARSGQLVCPRRGRAGAHRKLREAGARSRVGGPEGSATTRSIAYRRPPIRVLP